MGKAFHFSSSLHRKGLKQALPDPGRGEPEYKTLCKDQMGAGGGRAEKSRVGCQFS